MNKIDADSFSEVILCMLLAIVVLIASACTGRTSVEEGPPVPGKLSLALVDGLEKAGPTTVFDKATQSDSLNFNLGEIRGSKNFFFALNNAGGTIVTDVHLTMPESSFTIYPARIDTLVPNPAFQFDRIKIIRVSAIHGTPLEGEGYPPLMPQGLNTGSLMLTATSLNQSLELFARVQVYALLMEVTFHDGIQPIDLRHPQCSVLTGARNYGTFIYCWYIHDTLRAQNTGNVNVALTDIGENVTATLIPGEIYVFNPTHGGYTAELDGLGVVSDNSLFPKLTDGKTYFSFFR